MSPVRGDAKVPGSEAPGFGREAGVEAGWNEWPVRSMKRSLQRRQGSRSDVGKRRCRACVDLVKAMEDAWVLGAGVDEPSGVGDVERSHGCRGNWRGPPRPVAAGDGSVPTYNRATLGKWSVVERESEGVVVVATGRTTQPVVSEGPLLHRCTTEEERSADECRGFG